MNKPILAFLLTGTLTLGALVALSCHAQPTQECRDDETGEIIEVDSGSCPDGTHPTGGWVGDDGDGWGDTE